MRMGGTFLGSNNKGNPFKKIIKNGNKISSVTLLLKVLKK